MNIHKYYLYKFFHDLMPIYPIYVLLFESKGLSVSEISLLLAIWSLPLILLEIPTGVLSDRWSRKNMIVLGGALKAACYCTWIFAEGFTLFAVGFLLWGISECFNSGSEEALLYDSLLSYKRDNEYDKILGRGRALSGVSTVISAVCGGFIGLHFGMEAALVLSIISVLAAVIIAFTFKEINYYKNTKSELYSDEKEETFREALAFLVKNKGIFLFTLMSITVIGMAGIVDEFDPLIAKNYGLTLNYIGVWVGIRFVFASFGSYIAFYIKRFLQAVLKIRDAFYIISLICIVALVFLGVAGLVGHIWIMGLYGLFFLLMSAGEVLQEDYIQQKIGDEGRSTVHSLISMAYNIYGTLTCVLLGLILTKSSVHGMLVIVVIYCISLALIIGILYKKGQSSIKGYHK